uniref:Uncharacterized protein n=1 Tax=Arundo donax TaxID=35708 RepID=A0A0A9A465_ARUDO
MNGRYSYMLETKPQKELHSSLLTRALIEEIWYAGESRNKSQSG